MKNILIVEDETILLNVLKNRFSEEGFNVITAENGIEALERVNESEIDLILLDIMMPKKDGYEVLQELMASKHKNIPVIVLTNLTPSVDNDVAMTLGAKAYYVKAEQPINELIEKVKKFIK